MPTEVVMPQMGESIFEGTITKWLKKPGDKVQRDEPLFEISTDKVDAEIPSPSAGVLKEIKVGEGQTVPIQTIVGVIDAAGSAVSAPAPAPTRRPIERIADRCFVGSRKPIARTRPDTSAKASCTVASPPSSIVRTRKIAAGVSGARTGCGWTGGTLLTLAWRRRAP